MNKLLIIPAAILLTTSAWSQAARVVVANHPSKPLVQVKYYTPQIFIEDGVNVYRRESGTGDWTKLNSVPLKKGTRPPAEELQRDKELAAYVNMLDSATRDQLRGFVLLTVLIKSFSSESFSNYLGILYEDATARRGTQYEYRVSEIKGNNDVIAGTSASITAGSFVAIDPPADVQLTEGKKGEYRVLFSWRPETERYFGVNVYRSVQGTSEVLLTRNPVLVSKVATEAGEKNYPKEMFEDDSLQAGRTYTYHLTAVDFFGRESKRTPSLRIEIKDSTSPPAPDRLASDEDHLQRRINLTWRGVSAADLAGYNVYRASKSDGPWQKVSIALVPSATTAFSEQVPKAAGYYYYVASVDRAGNESPSGPTFVEIKDVIPPAQPKNVTIKSDTGKVTVSWGRSPEPDMLGYLIYRTVNSDGKDSYVLLNAAPMRETSITDILPPNVRNKFIYRIVAVDSARNKSEMSSPTLARLPDATAPDAPFIKNVTTRVNGNLVEWLPIVDADARSIKLWKTQDGKDTLVMTGSPKSVSYEDMVTSSSSTIEYFATVVDSAGNTSARSNAYAVSRRAKSTIGKINVSVSYDSTKRSIILSWSSNDDGRGFIVYRKENSGEFRPHTGMLPLAGYEDTEVRRGRSYTYRVRQFSENGIKAESESSTIDIKE